MASASSATLVQGSSLVLMRAGVARRPRHGVTYHGVAWCSVHVWHGYTGAIGGPPNKALHTTAFSGNERRRFSRFRETWGRWCLAWAACELERSPASYSIADLDNFFIFYYHLDRLARGNTMPRIWQLQEAKNKLSEVVDEALTDGPQVITKRGIETAIVLSYADYRKLLLNQQKLSDFFRESPLVGIELDLTRDTSPNREDIAL
jgi:prevent-host-death family protein